MPSLMRNPLIDRLGANFTEMSQQYETIVNRAADQKRDLTDVEIGLLADLRAEMQPLGERIIELRSADEIREASMRALSGDDYNPRWSDTGSIVPLVGNGASAVGVQTRTKLAPLVASDDQLRSVMRAVEGGVVYNAPLELRATITRPSGVEVVSWLPAVPSGREPRIAEAIASTGGDGTQAQWLRVSTPASAAVTAEGAEKPDSGMVLTPMTAKYEKPAAKQDVTAEMLADFANTDTLIKTELLGGLQTRENNLVVGAILNDPLILAPAVTATSRLIAILDVQAQVRNGAAKADPNLVILTRSIGPRSSASWRPARVS